MGRCFVRGSDDLDSKAGTYTKFISILNMAVERPMGLPNYLQRGYFPTTCRGDPSPTCSLLDRRIYRFPRAVSRG